MRRGQKIPVVRLDGRQMGEGAPYDREGAATGSEARIRHVVANLNVEYVRPGPIDGPSQRRNLLGSHEAGIGDSPPFRQGPLTSSYPR